MADLAISGEMRDLYYRELDEFDRLFSRAAVALTANGLIAGVLYFGVDESFPGKEMILYNVLIGIGFVCVAASLLLLATAIYPREYLRVDMAEVARWKQRYEETLTAVTPAYERAQRDHILNEAVSSLLERQFTHFAIHNQAVNDRRVWFFNRSLFFTVAALLPLAVASAINAVLWLDKLTQ